MVQIQVSHDCLNRKKNDVFIPCLEQISCATQICISDPVYCSLSDDLSPVVVCAQPICCPSMIELLYQQRAMLAWNGHRHRTRVFLKSTLHPGFSVVVWGWNVCSSFLIFSSRIETFWTHHIHLFINGNEVFHIFRIISFYFIPLFPYCICLITYWLLW